MTARTFLISFNFTVLQVTFTVVFSNTANEFTFTFGARALDRPTVVNLTNHTYCECAVLPFIWIALNCCHCCMIFSMPCH